MSGGVTQARSEEGDGAWVAPPHPSKDVNSSGWRRIPADGIGYLDSQEFLSWPEIRVKQFIQRFELERYAGGRNWKNLWRSTLGLDTTRNQRVLDYGCGFGIEALQFARAGNEVLLYDIHPTNVLAAKRVLEVAGYGANIGTPGNIDVFYSNGVLHHTPMIREILKREIKSLYRGGEVRLLLYSDKAWKLKTGTPLPPIDADVREHEAFPRYVKAMDDVGEYADWYNREKLEMRVGDFLTIERFTYIMENGMFCTATLKPKEA
jgi:SAM-dependent methyltransferase